MLEQEGQIPAVAKAHLQDAWLRRQETCRLHCGRTWRLSPDGTFHAIALIPKIAVFALHWHPVLPNNLLEPLWPLGIAPPDALSPARLRPLRSCEPQRSASRYASARIKNHGRESNSSGRPRKKKGASGER